jgi:hypothetical protein
VIEKNEIVLKAFGAGLEFEHPACDFWEIENPLADRRALIATERKEGIVAVMGMFRQLRSLTNGTASFTSWSDSLDHGRSNGSVACTSA